MKKYLCLIILLIFASCTSLNAYNKNISQIEINKINSEITDVITNLKEAANSNRYDEIKEIFLPTFKNNIIVKKLQEYDLSSLTFIFSEPKVKSNNKAISVMAINYNTASNYFNITWKKMDDGSWKISNVAEKK
ncbi:hypothetical protein [Leptotrichia sp. oral taxon 847]|uniref:hypothetical protein n=1 Tax=Leptotrichia sp. oral taxon 847 TaxID=1785996 RepID=UPI000768289A|nr:hypothetical protein [Leptotrichia sp. oral taxon 847]AMD95702.1 hypothetical protein AXF11_09015 [Leptotrichia sp. oral taxon 847]